MIKNQSFDGKIDSILQAAKYYEIGVFTSVPLMQGKLLSPGVIPEFDGLKPSLRALQFTRSTPGVLSPLVGHKSEQNVKENLTIMKIPALSQVEFEMLIQKLTKSNN
jgi:predicted aldo/keto reductase-like oxidoreductase